MLGLILVTSIIVFSIVVPVIALAKYYSPKKQSRLYNFLVPIVSFFTWPMVPIVLAMRNKDKLLMSAFWLSFLVMAVSGWYWCVLNIQTIIRIKEQLAM